MEKMEISYTNPNLNGNGNHSSVDSRVAINDKSNETTAFVNHAEIAWHEQRREWVGDRFENVQRAPPMEPILRYSFSFKHQFQSHSWATVSNWTTTYEDLLLTAEPFQQPIPLAVRKW
ncbi:hypothetical protein SDJN02_09215 [Cucurbita argyrosperma subsp. argyrosperma]|nr:hypothetical protein SDJN02_09215 [Cucurbita argyrosperma subsp. argyrosperma]